MVKVLLISPRQNKNRELIGSLSKQNKGLRLIVDTSIEYDFVVSSSIGCLFLSVKYHSINPEYIYTRLNTLNEQKNKRKRVQVLLCLLDCDSQLHQQDLIDIHAIAFKNQLSLLMCFSYPEVAKYLFDFNKIVANTNSATAKTITSVRSSADKSKKFMETGKNPEEDATNVRTLLAKDDIENMKKYAKEVLDGKSGGGEKSFISQLKESLSCVKNITKRDVDTLYRNFGTLANLAQADMDEIVICPGIGKQKVTELHKVFNEPWS